MRFWIILTLLLCISIFSTAAQEATEEAADLLEFENVTLLLLGDVIVENSGAVPGQVITLDTASNNEDCTQVSECAVILQTAPNLQGATLLLNGVTLSLDGATALVQAVPGDSLSIYALAGDVFVTVKATQAAIPVGSLLTIPLNAVGVAGAIESAAEPFDRALAETLAPALERLPVAVEVILPAVVVIAETTAEPDADSSTVETTPETGATSSAPSAATATATPAATTVPPQVTPTRQTTIITTATPNPAAETDCGEDITTVRNPDAGRFGINEIRFPSCIPLGAAATGEFSWVGNPVRFTISVLETCANCGWNFEESYALQRGQSFWTLQLVCLANSPRVTHRFGIQLFNAAGEGSDLVEFETIC